MARKPYLMLVLAGLCLSICACAADPPPRNSDAWSARVDEVYLFDVASDERPDRVSHVPDVPETPSPETCDNGIDDDGDRNVDCDDSDCWGVAKCPWPEHCFNDVDDDGDGRTDCDDPDCTGSWHCCPPIRECDPWCEDGFDCVGGGCVSNTLSAETYSPSANWALVAEVEMPTCNDPYVCGWDFTGDGEVDNGLAALLLALGVPHELHRQALATIAGTWLVEYRGTDMDAWRRWPQLSFWPGTNDLDGDGMPDQSHEAGPESERTFRVRGEHFTRVGAPLQFNSAAFDGGQLLSDVSAYVLPLALDSVLPGIGLLNIPIEHVRIAAHLDDSMPTRSIREGDAGGLLLGGVLPLGIALDLVDWEARGCVCAVGIEEPYQVIRHGENADRGRYQASCAAAPYDVSACDVSDVFCSDTLNRLCEALVASSGASLADLDTDNSGVPDAVTFGFRLMLVPATIADPWITSPP